MSTASNTSGAGISPAPEVAAATAAERLLTATTNKRETTDYDLGALTILQRHAVAFGVAIEQFVPESRDKSIAWTALEDALTRANKAIYRAGALLPGDD